MSLDSVVISEVEDSSLPVAVDALGGDEPLDGQIKGAIEAVKEFGSNVILVGPEDDISSILDGLGAGDLGIKIYNAPENILMGESPARAIRKKPNSSICVCYKLVNEGVSSSVIGAGNSGAMMAAGRILCGLLPGIERPAIATLVPGAYGKTPNVMLDVGANVDCSAYHLVQFAVMGSVYYSSLFEKTDPKIALLSNGTELSKGNDLTRNASSILSQTSDFNYVGYVEGRDIMSDFADVIICDGFSGNIVLKAMEGVVRVLFEHLSRESRKSLIRKLGMLLSKGLYSDVFRGIFDYTTYGGAPLLGLNKLSLVLHGSSDSKAIKNAIKVATSFSNSKMIEVLEDKLLRLHENSFGGDSIDIATNVIRANSSLLKKRRNTERNKKELKSSDKKD